MSFITVSGKDDQEIEDAVRRGVAQGLARLLALPEHPTAVQKRLIEEAQTKKDPGEDADDGGEPAVTPR